MVRLLSRFVAALPLAWVHRIGALAGWITYLASARYRSRLRENLARAVAGPPRTLLRAAVAEAGRQAFELPWILLRPREEVAARVIEVQGWEIVEAARQEGCGLLFLTPHLGCFEISAQFFALHAPITVLYRQPRKKALAPLIQAGRARGQMKLAPADLGGVRLLLQALRRGEAIGMLPDQVPARGEGVWAPFFGRHAWTMTLAGRLAEVSKVRVVMAWAQRLPNGMGYCLRLSAPREPITGTPEERAARINAEMERLIRDCPAQYLWGYNRYKNPSGTPRPEGEAA